MAAREHCEAALEHLRESSGYKAARAANKTPAKWLKTEASQCEQEILAAIVDLTPLAASQVIGFATGAGAGTPTSLTGSALDAYYQSVKAIGGNAVRFDCRGLTPQFDTTVRAALLAGLNVLILFPDDPTLAGPCAAKYVPFGVLDYETGNEPNIRGTTPAQWLAWNNSVYTAVKAVSKDTKVITAGLAPHGAYGQTDGIYINPVTYLEQTLKQGKILGDAVGWHPYSYWTSTAAMPCTGPAMISKQPWSAWTQMAETPVSCLSLIRQYGLPEKIAVTEFGAPTYPVGVTLQAQADLITLGIADLKSRAYIDDIYLYSLRDRLELTPDQAHFGAEGKPAAAAFAAAVK